MFSIFALLVTATDSRAQGTLIPAYMTQEAMSIDIEIGDYNAYNRLQIWLDNRAYAQATSGYGELWWENDYTPLMGYQLWEAYPVTWTATDPAGFSASTTAYYRFVDSFSPEVLWYLNNQQSEGGTTVELPRKDQPATLYFSAADTTGIGWYFLRVVSNTGRVEVTVEGSSATLKRGKVGDTVVFEATATDNSGLTTTSQITVVITKK